MTPNYNILIVEPSTIVREGLSGLLESIDIGLKITHADSISSSLKLSDKIFYKLVVVNPIVFNNSSNVLNRFTSHFQGVSIIGLISSYYNRNLCSNFCDCIYLNDDLNTIENIITKHLTLNNDSKSASDNSLSERETEVLILLVSGKSNKEIAEELFISVHTVVTHRKNLSNKLGVRSTAAMAIYAVANNIIDLNDSLKSIK
jgi:DNA-binding CsgD family transcriptional regulator